MNDFNENFHLILSKHSAKKSSALYSNNIITNKHTYTPHDVISSVSHQLNAIQKADSSTIKKRPSKDFYKFKKSTFLCVNNLSMLDEEPPKQTTKFDTQCVTDTQLIHIIEDAEMLHAHQGMTQEFETAFIHNTEKQGDESVRIQDSDDGVDMNKCVVVNQDDDDMNKAVADTEKIEIIALKSDDIEQNDDVKESFDTDINNIGDKDNNLEYMSQIVNEPDNKSSIILKSKAFQKIVNNKGCTETNKPLENSDYENSEVQQLSQVLRTKPEKFKRKKDKAVKFQDKNIIDGNSSEIREYNQLNQQLEIKDDETKRPPSPIFINKKVKMKSKSPSPLVFNLDQFEHFETLALSFLTSDDDNNAKHIIDSQILNKELHLNLNKDMEFLNSNILSPILHEKVDKEEHFSVSDRVELHETDKATSNKALNQLSNQNFEANAEINTMTAHEFSNDEILFSSDEEENYIHREVQDLPFTCALDSSFDNQSDILEETLYVGFQTASNRSIQVCAGSFARAKSLLSDVNTDDITVTELVNNCENYDKDRSGLEIAKTNDEESFDSAETNIKQTQIKDLKTLPNNEMGFMTASNKSINLSQKSLARCKKVFQDIDLNEDFDYVNVKENLLEIDMGREGNDKGTDYCNEPKHIIKDNMDLEGFDDEIIQEFENIEMSLEDLKESKGVTSKATSCNNIGVSNVTVDEVDVPFHEELNKNISKENISIEDVVLSQIIGKQAKRNVTKSNFNSKASSNKYIDIPEEVVSNLNINDSDHPKVTSKPIEATEITVSDLIPTRFIGFKTANNKEIKISDNALIKSIKIFKDIDCGEKNTEKLHTDKSNSRGEVMSPSQPSTSKGLLGFKTANNKDIIISEKAWRKSNDVFNNIDSMDLGFKTANNKDIIISEKAWRKSKDVFNNIDSMDLPKKGNNTHPNNSTINKEDNMIEKGGFNDLETEDHFAGFEITRNKTNITKQRSENIKLKDYPQAIDVTDTKKHLGDLKNAASSFGDVGFKSASNKVIKVSDKALAQTRNLFNDIDSEYSKECMTEGKEIHRKTDGIESKSKFSKTSTETKFVGFKTANNKNIYISNAALAQTRNIFKDIDSGECNLISKTTKGYPDFEEHLGIQTYDQSSSKSHDRLPNSMDIDGHKELKNVPAVASKRSFEGPDGYNISLKKSASISVKVLEKSKQMFINMDLQKSDNICENTTFTGFQTASNKQVKISEKALAHSRKIFKDINNINTDDKSTEVKASPEEILQENQIYMEATDDLAVDENKDIVGGFKGFQTANKKPVTVPKSALHKSKMLFKDFDEQKSDNIFGKSGFTGFQTASNKQVKISDKALANSRKIFKDIDSHDSTNAEDNITKAKALYPEEILQENEVNMTDADDLAVDNNKDTVTGFKGFQTASKKPVTISKSALEKSKILFKDLDEQKSDNIFGNTGFTGFQTASNRQVKISEKALANSRKIFKDIDNIDNINAEGKITKVKALYPEEILEENQINIEVTDDLAFNDSKNTVKIFKGFQTASKKPVIISKSALEKSKKLFEGLEDDHETTEFCTLAKKEIGGTLTDENKTANARTSKDKNKKDNIFEDVIPKTDNIQNDKVQEIIVKPFISNVGFQTGNNKAIAVSEDALAKSKRLFSELDEEDSIRKRNKAQGTEDIHAMLDTQVLNNFEKSLHTEDFVDVPKNCKRSGSPILSCPRAKKRKKFETPYTAKKIAKTVVKQIEEVSSKNSNICYREHYKKNKKFTLKDLNNMTKNTTKAIDPYLLNFEYNNLLKFEFNHDRNDIFNDNMTIETLKEYFLSSVNSKLVPNGWLDNHIQLILWKLISYEVKFKSVIVCTARNVLEQLKYRYDKELYNAQRPALRKIFEKDDVPSKTMVLCIVGIYVDDVIVSSITNTSSTIELLLTDGWYSIRCNIDRMLTQLVCTGKITVGCKIVTSGAELVGGEQGVSPWEDTSAIRLKIYGNSSRRARWDARLGYLSSGPMLSQLSSIQVQGGKVSRLRVFVTRVYPALYVEKFEDGSTVTRSERLENIHQMKTEAERQAFMEKLYEEVEKEFADQDSQDSGSLSDSNKRASMDSGSQIAKMMKRSKDPAEFRAHLTGSQRQLLEAHTSKSRDQLIQDMQARIRDRLDKAGSCGTRNVVSLLKIRVAGMAEKGDSVEVTKGMMSIWKPNDAISEVIKEGAWIDVMNVVPTAVRYSEIQISAGRQSVFSVTRYKEPDKYKPYTKVLQRQCYPIKNLTQNPSMSTDYNEIDTVGLIFLIDPSIKEFDSTKQSFQNVYITDADKNIICINFWGGLKKFGYQNVLDTGQITACVNLQKRAGNTRKSIPQFRVTEFSYFTQTPKNDVARKMVDNFNKKFFGLDRRKFCQDCVVIKNNYLLTKNNENISPYRFMNTDIIKNKAFIDSPLLRPNTKDENFNLTGLDFESSFKQDSELSEEMLKRKKKVNEKIARLKMYGEPPPLSPIHIINKSKQACSSYKSPYLLSHNNSNSSIKVNENCNLKTTVQKSDSSENVTSVENTPQKCGVQREISNSPVLLNRTYVKSVNPMKINFDVQENNDSNIDHFADEFEGSPPLSLD